MLELPISIKLEIIAVQLKTIIDYAEDIENNLMDIGQIKEYAEVLRGKAESALSLIGGY